MTSAVYTDRFRKYLPGSHFYPTIPPFWGFFSGVCGGCPFPPPPFLGEKGGCHRGHWKIESKFVPNSSFTPFSFPHSERELEKRPQKRITYSNTPFWGHFRKKNLLKKLLATFNYRQKSNLKAQSTRTHNLLSRSFMYFENRTLSRPIQQRGKLWKGFPPPFDRPWNNRQTQFKLASLPFPSLPLHSKSRAAAAPNNTGGTHGFPYVRKKSCF